MNHQQINIDKAVVTTNTSKRRDTYIKIMYAYYFIYMTLLTVLESSQSIMAAVLSIVWIKEILMLANFVGIVLCVYLIITNKQKAIWMMEHMPEWMLRPFYNMPDWMGRFINHTFMRVMMISCDLMLIWMCVGFAFVSATKFGW